MLVPASAGGLGSRTPRVACRSVERLRLFSALGLRVRELRPHHSGPTHRPMANSCNSITGNSCGLLQLGRPPRVNN
eukprot:15463006-Alexandrium_andersonii.AAC.1